MSTVFTQAMDVLFADASRAVAGTFTPAVGTAVALRVILGQHDPELVLLGGQAARAPGWFARLRTAELPTRPRDGDRLTIDARDYLVRSVETDVLGTSWVVALEAAA